MPTTTRPPRRRAGRATRRTRALLGAAAATTGLLAASVVVAGATPAGPTTTTASSSAATPAVAVADGVIPAAIVDRYLARRPVVGSVTVVDVGGASAGDRILAATLQGVVNRSTARIYLRGADGQGGAVDQYWLDRYVDEGLVSVGATTDLGGALDAFAGEVAGFVVADAAEPWTINAATSIAGVHGAVVAMPDQIADLTGRGLVQLDDTRGRWPDAATAYAAVDAAYHDQFAYQGTTILRPDQHNSRDFAVQQGGPVVFTRPGQSDFDAVYDLVDGYPSTHPVYGYVSDDGAQEIVAVGRLAQMGRFLVPTDTTDNISFHVAVGASAARATAPSPAGDVDPCSPDDVNVVLAFSDGDNIRIAQSQYRTATRWGNPARGTLPLGWSMGPSTAVLLPAIWDSYAETRTDADQLVGIMGLGYTYAALLPDPSSYLHDGFVLSGALGLATYWSLDVLLNQPAAPGWAPLLDAADAAGAPPDGVLVNYTNFGGPPWFWAPDGTKVLNSQTTLYESGVPALVDAIEALQAAAPGERPLVAFFSVTAWNATLDELAAAMAPLAAQGVRFLTPSEAFACLPDAPVPPSTTSTAAPTTSTPPSTGAAAVVATPTFAG